MKKSIPKKNILLQMDLKVYFDLKKIVRKKAARIDQDITIQDLIRELIVKFMQNKEENECSRDKCKGGNLGCQ